MTDTTTLPEPCGEKSPEYFADTKQRVCIRPTGHRLAHTDGECWWGGPVSLNWLAGLMQDDKIVALQARVASLSAENRAMREDTERLDFLIRWFDHHDDFEGSGVRDWDDNTDARAAIDAASAHSRGDQT
jgi:hypothetical protein